MALTDHEHLDNPVWYSLTEGHRSLAIGDGLARRYPPDMGFFAALADDSDTAWHDLATIVGPGQTVALFNQLPPQGTTDWKLMRQLELTQMICARSPEVAPELALLTTLTEDDVPAIRALVELTHPGPFLERTIELGSYLAICQDEQIVAMAGERFWLDGYREISAVCTRPEYQGRGYARQLMHHFLAEHARYEQVSFLHVVGDNPAQRLYEKVGFRKRAVFTLSLIQRSATE